MGNSTEYRGWGEHGVPRIGEHKESSGEHGALEKKMGNSTEYRGLGEHGVSKEE